jgi:transcription initiation factor TFIIIB Brf1 subunit/transcription initiation factor TFIIB
MEESKKLERNLDKSNEKLHISDVISRFIEKLGVKHNIDEKYIMISYDKKDGTLDVWKQTSGSSILLEQILINDL